MGCEGYDYPEDPFILKGSCQLIYSLRGPRDGRSNGGHAYDDDGSWASSSRSWENGNNPSWDGSKRGGPGTESGFGSRLITWAVLGVFGYVFFNMFLRHVPAGAGESVERVAVVLDITLPLTRRRWAEGERGGGKGVVKIGWSLLLSSPLLLLLWCLWRLR